MANFLNSHHSVAELSDLIKSSEQFLIIISPYLKIPNNFKNILKSLNFQKIDGRIIYDSRNPLKQEELDFLKNIKGMKLFNCENLHAKCFINEKMGIITSMNLYEYSQTNNWEMGMLFTRKDDTKAYTDVLNDINFMSKNFQLHDSGILKKISDAISVKSYCIRCKAEIDYNPKKPLCNSCYPKWAQFKKYDYTEKYCHGCGEHFKNLSYSRPLCPDCLQDHREFYQ
jgi:phosphatidylserine/phosphatidylglycerophosphate/cardiolipin synthase-like enzyme